MTISLIPSADQNAFSATVTLRDGTKLTALRTPGSTHQTLVDALRVGDLATLEVFDPDSGGDANRRTITVDPSTVESVS